MPIAVTSPWLPYPAPAAPAEQVTLYCLPHAGAGASGFLEWRRVLPPQISVVPLQPPGREMRFRDRPFEDVHPLVDDLLEAMAGRWRTPFALFGHSMGALIAYELARRLCAEGHPKPAHLFVSGRRAPQVPARVPLIHEADEAEFADVVRSLGGTPDQVLADETLRRNLFTLLRADFAVNETYRHRPGPPLDLPVTVFGGTADPKVSPGELAGWRDCAAGPVGVRLVAGDHFFVVSQRASVLDHIARKLIRTEATRAEPLDCSRSATQ
ncbi:thioesterase II family protein [Nocardia sp. NPDC006044]|uniref:thioesterase II family protein n=1 Tax=Nocardia sp. NPDC006044 TaxID=3364306 RepID=UPI00369B6223